MIALVRGVTRFTFARLQFRRLWFSVSGLFLHFVDLKIVCPRSRGPWTRADAGKDSDGIPPPTAIFTRRKRRMCGCLARLNSGCLAFHATPANKRRTNPSNSNDFGSALDGDGIP